jgi:uncharacterized repeat protein (TIGR01451 family)
VATISATDNVGVTGFRFAVTGTSTSADGYYQIASDGTVTLTAAGVAAGVANNDYETGANSFTYGIQAGDSAGNWSPSVDVTFNVTNVEDTPPVVGAGQSFNYAENQSAGALIGTVTATDNVGVTGFRFDATGTATSADGYYEIAADGKITITSSGVAVGVANNDYEKGSNSFTYAISARDAAGNWSSSENVTLNVTNVDDSPNPEITVTKTPSSATIASPSVGTTINYTITGENTGNVPLTSISISDTLTGGATLTAAVGVTDDGEMDVGEIWTWTASYQITQSDIDAGFVENIASITASSAANGQMTVYSGARGTPSTSTSSPSAGNGAITTLAEAPALTVTKTASSTSLATPIVGTVISYTIAAKNTGNVTLSSVTLADTLTSGGTLQTVAGVTNDGLLNVGETWTWTASYTVTQSDIDTGSVENVASVTAQTASGGSITIYSGASGSP